MDSRPKRQRSDHIMEEAVHHFAQGLSWPFLILMIAVSLLVLAKGADVLVEEAVTLSLRWGISAAIVGATIVSLGTTAPEAAVSVLAALRGSPGPLWDPWGYLVTFGTGHPEDGTKFSGTHASRFLERS